MNQIVPIKGSTTYTIILDPSVWIFDQRKIDLEQYTATGELKTVAEREATGSYGIPFRPFLQNAAPLAEAKQVKVILATEESVVLTLEEAMNGILGFALQGKSLGTDGPLHFYYGSPNEKKEPIRQVTAFEVTV